MLPPEGSCWLMQHGKDWTPIRVTQAAGGKVHFVHLLPRPRRRSADALRLDAPQATGWFYLREWAVFELEGELVPYSDAA